MFSEKNFLKGWDHLPFIIFSFRNAYYAINAESVESIVFLPELSSIEEAPDYFVGVFNLRGKVLPVMDLDKRFGYARGTYSLTDSVIVIHYGAEKIGIIVNEIQDLKNISVELIENKVSMGDPKASDQSIIAGQIKVDDRIITLLDHGKLFARPADGDKILEEKPFAEYKERYVFSASIHADDEKAFKKRALDLMLPVERSSFENEAECYAVFSLSGETFAINIELVKEFSEVTKVFPTPCCPDFILGDINLRGDILTLIDIRSFLNLSIADEIEGNKVVVVQTGDLIVGIQVDDVLDVAEIDSLNVLQSPKNIEEANIKFIKGVLPYKEDMMVLIDLPRFLASESLIVNEEV
jgi:purine-binding chemotaxis protein CheW